MKKNIFLLIIFVCCFDLSSKEYNKFSFNNKTGLIDNNRKVVLENKYDVVKIDDLFIYCCNIDDSYDIYDKNLKFICKVPKEYRISGFISKNELKVYSHGFYSIFDIRTRQIKEFPEKYIDIFPFVNNRRVVLIFDKILGKGFGIEDKLGNLITQLFEETTNNYSEGLLPVIFKNGKSGYIDKNGKLVIEFPFYYKDLPGGRYTEPYLKCSFSDGVAVVQKEKNEWYVLDKKGRTKLISQEYQIGFVKYYKNGLLPVKNNLGKYGYINKNVEEEISFIFDDAKSFDEKYAQVVYQGENAVVDKKGNIYYCKDFCK